MPTGTKSSLIAAGFCAGLIRLNMNVGDVIGIVLSILLTMYCSVAYISLMKDHYNADPESRT